jgi:AraC-like DNA-binding protein
MIENRDILEMAQRQPIMQEELELLHTRETEIPGSVQYRVSRYKLQPNWAVEDTGMMVYNYVPKDVKSRSLELRFCVVGNRYCSEAGCGGNNCKKQMHKGCDSNQTTVDVYQFRFTASYLSQFGNKNSSSKTDQILNFKLRTPFSKMVSLCGRTRNVLENILQHNYDGTLGNLYINSQLQSLLFYAMECLVEEKGEDSFACKFLANEQDRAKIVKAREVLLQHIGNPITIKELSRKVAINECYLKKGFKEIFGQTIFDFYQGERMKYARHLLYEKGVSVTEVSMLLGYSSISHFSTAFKKHTGLKPCELLFRSALQH